MEIIEFKDYPNTETPLSAYNLNRMQNNIKDEVNTQINNIEQEGIIVSPTEPTTNPRKVWLQNVDNNEKIHVLNDNNVYEEFMKKHEDIYSTEEQVVGKWIDGKPLYRKGFSGSFSDNQIIASNIENIINCSGIVHLAGLRRLIPYYEIYENSTYCFVINVHNDNNVYLNLFSEGNATSAYAYFYIEYTKTTD